MAVLTTYKPCLSATKIWSILIIVLLSGCTLWEEDTTPTHQIGVMLPFTGDYAAEWNKALDWAVENINTTGGVAGRPLQLVKIDIAKGSVLEIADQFLSDPEIKAVIGPLSSGQVFEIAPKFITGKKVLMAPVASAANISKAFSGYDFFWRLTEPDISQTKTLLLLAKKGGAHKVGLITEESDYGASFEDWFGYFATELGLEVTGIQVIQPGDVAACQPAWNDLVNTIPDVIISALNQPVQNIEIARAYRNNGQQVRLLLSDTACLPVIIDKLGSWAENLEGVNFASNPSSGFDVSYKVKYGNYPGSFLSNVYDAVTLLALGLEASQGEGNESLAQALKKVVSGRDGNVGWQREELSKALRMIRDGQFPNIVGASGSLDFDELNYTDVVSSTYGHWRVDARQFVITDFYTSDGQGRISSTTAAYQVIAEKRQQFNATASWPELLPKKNLYAILIATSNGWQNYRHQADVLKTYQLLRKNGVTDDQIILIIADDLANSVFNNNKGWIRNELDGENLYKNVTIDYNLNDVTDSTLWNLLLGNQTEMSPVLLESTKADNIFIFTSGHGIPGGMVWEGTNHTILTPMFWKKLFQKMHDRGKFRQIFWANESCYSGKIGEAIQTPGVMLMTGANATETSKAWIYDTDAKTWLANKFAFAVNSTIASNPEITFSDLYERCYSYVNGSHVSFYNYQNFGNIFNQSLKDFVQP